MPRRLVPQLVTSLRGYSRDDFAADLSAGIIVGIVALPLAIAFGIASGVTPQQGMYTAIIAGFLISALGGSTVQIGGPTGAFVVIVYGIVQQYGYPGLAAATVLAGVILVAMGVAGLGGAIKFIPYPVTTGFTAGIALIIASQQVRDVLGLRMTEVPAEFFDKWAAYGHAIGTVNWHAAVLTAAAVAIIVLWPRVTTKVPSPFVALIVCTAATHLLGLRVETIGSRFGEISFAPPAPRMPSISWGEMRTLVSPAITIALLGAIESLLSAVVADGMTGKRHRSNMELIGQGVANIASPIFGGIPATGAIARTATNVRNGGRTPVAGMVHAVVLLLIALFLGKWAALIPMAVLGAILLVVAYNMSEWHAFATLMRAPRSDVIVLLITFVLTVVVDLTVAIEVGMVLAAFLFMKRMSEVTNVGVIAREFTENVLETDPNSAHTRKIPRGVVVYEINGPFFFGAAETFKDTLARTMGKPRVLILRLRNVPAVDATGMRALVDVVRRSQKDGSLVLLSDVHAQPVLALGRAGILDEIGEDNIFGNVDDALNRARRYLGLPELPPPSTAVPTVAREIASTPTPAEGLPAINPELLRKRGGGAER
ncbi:MAG TPA: SulP family inorganic anion transporter [Gemmatimonadaceae bacterium]|nr:SulP family inorganic anion transporter [Gemmatimonadaceae bacterium]